MKICMVGGLAGPNGMAGGVWRVANEQRQLLVAAGYEVVLLGMWLGKSEGVKDFEVVTVHRPFPGAGLRALFSVRARSKLVNAISNSDVVHIHLARDYFTSTAVDVAAKLKKPIVVQTHGMYAPSSKRLVKAFDRLFSEPLVAKVGTWLTLTDLEEDQLMAMGVDQTKIRRVPNAIREPTRRRGPRRDGHFSFISRLQTRKQPDVFARAAVSVWSKRPDTTFTIAGPDQGLGDLVASIASSVPPHVFTIPGPISEERVMDELASSTAVVLPSRGEVAPMIAIEAAATGTPLILTNDCGLAPTLAARSAALVVVPEEDAVASAMLRLLEDASLRAELSQNIRLAYEELWSPERLRAALEVAYREAKDSVT